MFYGIPIGSVGSQRVAVPVAVRRKVLARSSCEYCGDTHGPFEVDHIVAVSRGGGNEADNLALACFQCNRAKSDKSLTEHSEAQLHALSEALETQSRLKKEIRVGGRALKV